jgi:hypothetical protein
MLRLRRVGTGDVPWEALDGRPDRSVFQTRAWLELLRTCVGVEPVVARVDEGSSAVGWFAGGLVRRAGLRVVGSPMPGWATSYMGFTLDDPALVPGALDALRRFAFGELRAVHLEVLDRAAPAGPPGAGWRRSTLPGWELDLAGRDDATLLAGMTSMARRNVRRAERDGVVVEEVGAEDAERFAAEHLAQARWVFALRGRHPTIDERRVATALRLLGPAGHVVALRARDAAGRPVATGVFPGLPGATAVLWSVAGDERARELRANEALVHEALRRWRDRGAARFDFGGGGDYKAKFGGRPIEVPWLRTSRWAPLAEVRDAVAGPARRWAGRLRGVPAGRP